MTIVFEQGLYTITKGIGDFTSAPFLDDDDCSISFVRRCLDHDRQFRNLQVEGYTDTILVTYIECTKEVE